MTEDVQANPLVFSSLKLRVKTETLADTEGPYNPRYRKKAAAYAQTAALNTNIFKNLNKIQANGAKR